MKPSELLESGKMKWIQGNLYRYRNGYGKVGIEEPVGCCTYGAIDYICSQLLREGKDDEREDVMNRYFRMRDHIDKTYGVSVPKWNDMKKRRKEDVIDMLKKFDL